MKTAVRRFCVNSYRSRRVSHGAKNFKFANDAERFAWIREHLYVPAVCDILDDLGPRQQAMHQRLRPLDPDNCTIVGRARTFRWMETDYVVEEDPYGLEIDCDGLAQAGRRGGPFHRLRRHECALGRVDEHGGQTQRRRRAASATARSATASEIMTMNFPVSITGIRPLDSKGRGRVMAYDVPVRCGDVLVRPGELVFADFDGVVVVPRDVEDEVLRSGARESRQGKRFAPRPAPGLAPARGVSIATAFFERPVVHPNRRYEHSRHRSPPRRHRNPLRGHAGALWQQGHHVTMAVFTCGDMGDLEIPRPSSQESARQKAKQPRPSSVRGCSGRPSWMSTSFPTRAQRRLMIDLIRQADPDVILTHSPNDYHPDHRYVSQLVFDSYFQKGLPHIPDNPNPPAASESPRFTLWTILLALASSRLNTSILRRSWKPSCGCSAAIGRSSKPCLN